jgi:preprotein translocase subunit SecA
LIEYQREGFDMFSAMLDGIKEETITHLFNVRVQAAPPPPPAVTAVPADGAAAVDGAMAVDGTAPADDAVSRTRPNPVVTPARAPVAANGSGRHSVPEPDPNATTGVLPTVFGGNGPRRAAELQYSGPAEDGTTDRSRRADAAGQGSGAGEPARNRPCPCGSGRKYKHCHGAPTVAHP